MKNNQTIFSCSKCGAQYPKWQGRCLECGSWGSLIEENVNNKKETKILISAEKPINLSSFKELNESRFSTGLEEFDRVLAVSYTHLTLPTIYSV